MGERRTGKSTDRLSLVWTVIFAAALSIDGANAGYKHTVAMGTSATCDDAVHGVEIDWDPKDSTPYTCPATKKAQELPISEIPGSLYQCPNTSSELTAHAQTGILQAEKLRGYHHKCLNVSIRYRSTPYPASGMHRPAWPKYGSYTYLPPQRYLHNLEHGAVVAIYHPCAPDADVEKFKDIIMCEVIKRTKTDDGARQLSITPSVIIPACQPFVLLAWQKRLLLSEVHATPIKDFFEAYYRKGPEDNKDDGQYQIGLLKESGNFQCNS